MPETTSEDIFNHLADVAADVDTPVDEVLVFGSTARGERDEDSDTDVIVISSAFDSETPVYERAPEFLKAWDYDYGPVDFLCLTPEEFEEKKDDERTAVAEAVEEGVSVDLEDV